MNRILPLDPLTYKRHLIHGENRIWSETNCYSDVIIELLHALGFEPTAALAFTLGVDFEGDQWTFFKFLPGELSDLFGLEIQEFNPWRSLAQHIEEQIKLARPVLVELDSYYLPDTAGTAYKLAHVKSTVAVNEIDIQAKRLGYFHNQGYFNLEGEDFTNIFQTSGLVHERMLPPYIEYVKRSDVRLSDAELLKASLGLLKKHMARIPKANPFLTFKKRFEKDLEWLMKEPIETFHGYSFANLRQYGACFELSTTYLRWLDQQGVKNLTKAIESFDQISQTAKSYQFMLARAMARRKPLDLAPLDVMATLWNSGMTELSQQFL
jgi:hypothetical protein